MARSFCIIGKFGSGKTTLSDHLIKRFPGLRRVGSSDMWNKVAGRKLTHYEAMVFQKGMVEKHGEGYFARMFVETIKDQKMRHPMSGFIIDGIRTEERLEAVKRYFGDELVTIGIVSKDKIRKERVGDRDSESGKFDDRERRENEQFTGLEKMIKECDIVIVNDYGDVEEFKAAADKELKGAGVR